MALAYFLKWGDMKKSEMSEVKWRKSDAGCESGKGLSKRMKNKKCRKRGRKNLLQVLVYLRMNGKKETYAVGREEKQANTAPDKRVWITG